MSSVRVESPPKLPSGIELSVESVRDLVEKEDDAWKLAHAGKTLRVWTKPSPKCDFHVIKITATFNDIESSVVFNVLQDMNYRKKWDKYFRSAKIVGRIDCTSDVCHYSVKSPPPFKNRDFVLHRVWLDNGAEKWIIAKSICHKDVPPDKQLVRGVTYHTLFHIQSVGQGCQLTYITDSDPRGKLPAWVTNHVTKLIIPKLIKKLQKGCRRYEDWQKKHPGSQTSRQSAIPLIDPLDCSPCDEEQSFTVDESRLKPKPVGDSDSDDS